MLSVGLDSVFVVVVAYSNMEEEAGASLLAVTHTQ
jgi:hypothetical protein